MLLTEKVKSLRAGVLKDKIEERLLDFQSFQGKNTKKWFSELCFCILTANSKAATAWAIQKELGAEGFCNSSSLEIKQCIQKHKHRFHNNKTRFIVLAREHIDIRNKVLKLIFETGQKGAREWLVVNIKGIGYKESSHFLRNVGYTDLAILDRHVLNLLVEHGYIKEKPKSLSKKKYHEIEKILEGIADELKITQAELDMYLWYMKAGEVLK